MGYSQKQLKALKALTYGVAAGIGAGWTAGIRKGIQGGRMSKDWKVPQKITTLKNGGAVPRYYNKGGKLEY